MIKALARESIMEQEIIIHSVEFTRLKPEVLQKRTLEPKSTSPDPWKICGVWDYDHVVLGEPAAHH